MAGSTHPGQGWVDVGTGSRWGLARQPARCDWGWMGLRRVGVGGGVTNELKAHTLSRLLQFSSIYERYSLYQHKTCIIH